MKSYPNIFRKILFIFVIVLSNYFCSAQLSGSYTLGDTDCDYQSFEQIISDINNIGLISDIEFITEAGTYTNVSISNVLNPDGYNIVFRYNNIENDSVCIMGQLTVIGSPNICFRRFSIIPFEDQEISVVKVINSNNFTLDSCNIINLSDNEFDYEEGLILLEVPWEGPYLVVNINNCSIYSLEDTFLIKGKKGSIWIRDNIITGHVSNTYDGGSLHWFNNIIYCTLDNYDKTSQEFIGNTFYFNSIFDLNLKGNFFNNEFFTDINITASDLVENTFHKNVLINWCDNIFVAENIFHDTLIMHWCDNALVFANTFNSNVQMTWCSNALITGNLFNSSYNSDFSDAIRIRSNVFNENVNFNNYYTFFGNNIIYDTVVAINGSNNNISNNNFHKDSRLEINLAAGSLINNNLASLWIYPDVLSLWAIEFNNFVNLENNDICCFGENANFLNPMYNSEDDLRSSNPLLIGKGGDYSSKFKYDIDSIRRKVPCTVGANEICFNWVPDSIAIQCRDSLILDLCIDTMDNAYWWPSYIFEDTTSTKPKIFPENDETIYLISYNGLPLDSLFISSIPNTPMAEIDYSSYGYEVLFINKSRCASDYLWDFGDGETSTEFSPIHSYEFDGFYECMLIASNELEESDTTYLDIQIVGLEENSILEKQIIIYPNPAKNYINLNSISRMQNLVIIDQRGVIVYTEELNTKNKRISIQYLREGLYIVEVNSLQGSSHLKFMKKSQ